MHGIEGIIIWRNLGIATSFSVVQFYPTASIARQWAVHFVYEAAKPNANMRVCVLGRN